MPARLRLALTGNLQKTFDARKLAYLKGLKSGTQSSVDQGKNEIRADIKRAGMGQRLANTVRGDVFPAGSQLSYSPSGLIYSNAPHIIAGHADTDTRRPSTSTGLLIPIKGNTASEKNVRRHEGETLEDALIRKWGKKNLFWNTRPGKNPVLYARVIARGRLFVRNGATTRQAVFSEIRDNSRFRKDEVQVIAVATFVKNFKSEKRIDTRNLLARASRRHPARLAFHLREHLRRSEQETSVL